MGIVSLVVQIVILFVSGINKKRIVSFMDLILLGQLWVDVPICQRLFQVYSSLVDYLEFMSVACAGLYRRREWIYFSYKYCRLVG